MVSSKPKIDWRFLLLMTVVIAVICHGSLYPYTFMPHGGAAAPLQALLASWRIPPTGFADGVANVFLYLPLGFAGVLALGYPRRLVIVTILGLVLSTTIEIAQFFDVGRFTNMSDVYCNTAGTLLGGLAGTRLDTRLRGSSMSFTIEAVPVTILAVLLAYRLYPYVPTIDVHKYWHSLSNALLRPVMSPLKIFEYFVLWLTTCYLVNAAFRNVLWLAVPCSVVLLIAAKVVIVNLSLGAAELIGAVIAVFLWLGVLERSRYSALVVATFLGMMVLVYRLQPFDFHTVAVTPFGWVPFRSIVEGSVSENFVAFGEKIFLYASLIWITSRTGLSLLASTTATTMLLLVTSLAETHIPGRSAEITDCVIAVLLGAGLAALDSAAPLRARTVSEQKEMRTSLHIPTRA